MFEHLTIQEVTLLVVGILVVLSFIMAIISLILETDRSRQWFGDWFQGLSTEMLGAAVTTIFFTFIVGAAEQQQSRLELQTELIGQMSSSVNSEAIRASEELRAEGWLRDGTLRGQEFSGANLEGAQIHFADLADAIFFDVNLKSANLEDANLHGVNLQASELNHANLRGVDLTDANLNAADIGNADLTGADLRGANLFAANLENATMDDARLDVNTILPDSIFNDQTNQYDNRWTPQTDMTRYTDPNHPDFWRPSADEFGAFPEWYTPPGNP